jgi:MFS family permease
VGFIGTFAFNFPIWLSAFDDDVFHGDAGMYGLLNTLMAVGSVVGTLLAARRGKTRMRLLVAAAFGMLEALAALAPSYWVFVLLLAPIGIFGLTFNTTANAGVRLATDPAMRGRVISLFMMVFVGGTPIGGPIMGWVTNNYGARGCRRLRRPGPRPVGRLRVKFDLHPGKDRHLIALVAARLIRRRVPPAVDLDGGELANRNATLSCFRSLA